MSRRRWLSTDISKDARVRRLAAESGEFAALVYTWAIPHAADDGSLPADPDELLMLVTPGFRWRSPEDMQAAIDGMLKLGLLEQHQDRLTFPPAAFYRYQTYVTAERRETAHNGAQQRGTPPSFSSSLGLGSGVTASAVDARAREADASRFCAACHAPLKRRVAHGLCSNCHGKALIAAKRANVDVTHISLGELVGLAMQPDEDLPIDDGTNHRARSGRTAAHSRGTPGSGDAPAA